MQIYNIFKYHVSGLVLDNRVYLLNRLEKIFVAYNIKYKINEVIIKNKNKFKFIEGKVALNGKSLIKEIFIKNYRIV